MANQLIVSLETLKSALGNDDIPKTTILLETIYEYFDNYISDAEKNLAIERVFDEDTGLVKFLTLSIKKNKQFKSQNIKVLQLIAQLIQTFKQKIIPYAVQIQKTCLLYINSMQTTAHEKENAALVVQYLVNNKLCENVDRAQLLKDLLRPLSGKKPSGKVLQRIYELIGDLSKDYLDCIDTDKQPIQIRDMFFQTLETTLLNQQEGTFAALTGALNGFKSFLVNFEPQAEHRPEFSRRLYICIKKLSDPPCDAKFRGTYRSALIILTEHAELFAENLLADRMYWHNLLTKSWMTSTSWEDRKTAIYLLHSFHRVIAKVLLDQPADVAKRILEFFIEYFRSTLESSSAKPYEIRIAIRGFGVMAEPCKKLLPVEHINGLLTLVMQRTENAGNALSTSSKNKDELEHFPDYVQALSQIMEYIDELSGIQLATLQNIIISLIRQFHLLSTAHHFLAVNSLIHTFHNLVTLGSSILDDVLERVTLQGVIWTCSHKLPLDVDNDWEHEKDWKEQITYKSYMSLWLGLLAEVDSSSFDRSLIVEKIYDHLIKTLFGILDKLDLATRKRTYHDKNGQDQEYFFCDPNYDLEPIRPKDFHMFFNLVDFYRTLLREQPFKNHVDHFTKWINQYFETLILKSIKYPLVSGFLKLLQTGFKIANRINYFNNDMYEENVEVYNNVVYYLKSIISRVEQTNGELQLACLSLLFSAPTDILKDSIIEMIPAFSLSFELGRNSMLLYIAEMALSALERYIDTKQRTSDEMKSLLKAVLPNLDLYLQGFTSETSSNVEIIRKRGKRRAQKMNKITETDLTKFQKRILLFLGKLEPDHCLFLVENENKLDLVKWDVSQTVCLTLYGPELNPKIYLDELMSRICEIAVNTTNRKKKVAACEIVHAVILYLIGTDNHRGKLWSELCSRMLLLGCDGDLAIQQMFEPLVMQVMHYMSQRSQLLRDGVVILLDCLMEAVSHPSHSLLRDLAARSLREFLIWTLKQSTREEIEVSPFNIETLLENFKLFSFDSKQSKRFGAALAFNNLYRVLREEEHIIDMYWLDLLNTFCINFMMCEQDGEKNGSVESYVVQITASLDHVERVLREKKNVFNGINTARIKPLNFDGTLKEAVIWLLKQCNSILQNYRHKTMDLFTKLVICVDGYNSAVAFIRDNQSVEDILELCEGGPNGPGIAMYPNLTHLKDSQSPISKLYEWLELLFASLDCYIWIIGEGLYQDISPLFAKSTIFDVIKYYLENISDARIIDIISLNDSQAMNETNETDDLEYSIAQMEKISGIKCVILLRIFDFIIKLLPLCHKDFPPEFFSANDSLITTVFQCLFKPIRLGFDLKQPKATIKLPHSVERLIVTIYQYAPNKFKQSFIRKLSADITDHYKSISDSAEATLSAMIRTESLDIVKGIEIVYRLSKSKHISLSKNLEQFLEITAGKILYQLFSGIKKQEFDDYCIINPPPDVQRYARRLLKISLYKTDSYVQLIDLLLNATELRVSRTAVTVKHGKYFLDLYKQPIFEYLLKEVEIVIEKLVIKIGNQNILYIIRILIDLCEFAYKHKFNDKPFLRKMVNVLLNQWEFIVSKSSTTTIMTEHLIELMSFLAMICPFPLFQISLSAKDFDQWLLNVIKNPEYQLELKSQAIFLLPCLVGPEHMEHPGISTALEDIKGQYFPLNSNEFREGSIERTGFVNFFQSLLDSLRASKSPVLLKFLISCTTESKHIMEYNIRRALERFIQHSNVQQQIVCLNIPYEIFINRQIEPPLRISVLQRFLCIMLRMSSVNTITIFYEQRIKEIVELCDTPFSIHTMTDWNKEHGLISRIGGYELIELLFGIMNIELLTDVQCPIGIALLGANKIKTGREIISFLSKKAHSVRKESCYTDNSVLIELFRKFQCAAYRTLCALVNNTQDQLKMYENLIFKENPMKNELIWRNLINVRNNDLYTDLTQEVDKNPKIKEIFVSINHESQSTEAPKKYLESQNVLDSSLSQDITKIDLSLSSVRTSEEVAAMQLSSPQNIYRIEKNSINDHEVMPSLCAVIHNMFNNNITPHTIRTETGASATAPSWVDYICSVIEDDLEHKNVRMFLAILIDNCRHLFKIYAPRVTKAILKVLASKCYGNTIDAFVIFMVANLLEWDSLHRIQSPEEISLASDLIKILMENAWNDKRDIFKKNLELIKRLVEIWKDFITLPKQLLFDTIGRSKQPESRDNVCGIQLNGIVLANGLIPWTEISKMQYLNTLSVSLDNNNAAVYQSASQVLGMALHQIIVVSKDDSDELDVFMQKLENRLETFRRAKDNKKFTDILYGIHKNYEPIVDNFLPSITNYITCVSGAIKRIYLEMLLSRVTTYEKDSYREVSPIRMKDLLRSNEYQLLALHIINKILPKMNEAEIRTILPDISTFVDSKYSDCRDVMYEILIYIHKNFKHSQELIEGTSAILLNGLVDVDENIRNVLFHFWAREAMLPSKLSERFISIFKDLYNPKSEKHFLKYCSQLLLEPAVQSTDSKQQILKHQNENESKFKEYDINTNWRSQNSLLRAPLFMESQQKQLVDGYIPNTQNLIRATVSDVMFEPTLDPSQVSQSANSFSLQTQSSLLFSTQASVLDRRSQRIDTSEATTQSPKENIHERLRQRILKDKEKTSRNLALKAIERHAYGNAMRAQRQKFKDSNVTLYRRYRIGDYPDLLINSLALLLPLRALVMYDAVLSRQVIVSIFRAVANELGPDQNPFINSMSECFKMIFEKTENCESIFFSTLVEIALSNARLFCVEPDILASISNANNMMAIGILLLEGRLSESGFSTNTMIGPSSTALSFDDQSIHWLKLASLYYNLSEYDVVAGIFSDKLSSDRRLTKAIEYESYGDYSKARDLYISCIGDTNSNENSNQSSESDFVYLSYFNCYVKMGRWSDLKEQIAEQIEGNPEELWADDWNKENLLPHYIRSELRMILNSSMRDNEFLANIQAWIRNPDRAEHIRTNFSEELMMLMIANKTFSEALVHSEEYFGRFLIDWRNISILSDKVRSEKVLNIRKIAEIHAYTQFLCDSNITEDIINDLVDRWSNTQMEATDSVIMWESLIAYRRFICALTTSIINNNPIGDSASANKLREGVFDMHFKLLDIALKQNNVELSNSIIAQVKHHINPDSIDKRSAQWYIATSKFHQLKSHNLQQMEAAQMLASAMENINVTITRHQDILNVNPDIYISALEQIPNISESFFDLVPDVDILDNETKQKILNCTQSSDKDNIYERIFDHAYKCMRDTILLAEKCEQSGSKVFSVNFSIKNYGVGECYNKLATFCQQYYGNEKFADLDAIETEKNIIISVLRGMRHHSKDARLQFPRILQLPNLEDTTLTEQFIEEAAAVPEWMFLGWLPQILSSFNFQSRCFLDDLLLKLSKAYPSALIYPFQLSCNEYQEKNPNTRDRLVVRDIKNNLRNEILEKFIESINCLCLPEQALLTHLSKIQKAIRLGNYTDAVFKQDVRYIIKTLFENPLQGKLAEKIAKYKNKIVELDSLDINRQRKQISKIIEYLMENVKPTDNMPKKPTLELFSIWLSKYHWCMGDNYIEVPGQYTGESRPNPLAHAKIIRFGKEIEIYRTLRKPQRLSIFASDAKTYNFLVKYSEDLRQDQRIQQLLALMTEKLRMDKNCREHNLMVQTYKVIPINSYCGMLSWVDNTEAMQKFFNDGMARHVENGTTISENIAKKYKKFIDKDVKHKAPEYAYGHAASAYQPRQIAENFEELEKQIPAAILKDALIDISSTPESFFVLRNNFATSLAAMNIANWILGIGDRHLNNILINIKNGKLIGIDYGMAFGAATLHLPIPELIPFRLTPHFVSVASPLETSGLIKKCMVHTLTAFRNSRKLLMACMEIFVNEPTIDWLEAANRKNSVSDESISSADSNWEPKVRIDVANRKLSGANPTNLTANDLENSVQARNKNYLNGYLRILQGNEHNIRSKMNTLNLSADEQVDCLIDLATDPAILGITYAGYTPWV